MTLFLGRLTPGLRNAGLNSLLVGLMVNAVMAQQAVSVGSSTADRIERSAAMRPEDEATPAALLSTIRRLEERVRQLEAILANGRPGASESLSVSVVQEEIARLKEQKSEEEKRNGGFLSFFQSTEISGFVDAYYHYNFNRPSGDTQLRNFDSKHHQFSFNLAEIALEKKVTPADRLGFRMDLNFGPAAETVHAAEPGGVEMFKHLQQAYLSYLAPAGAGLQLDVGKFVTPHGAEVIETKDNWNYSRSLLFALAIPYYHFGVRATYPLSDSLTLSGYVVNGWNNVVDNNTGKTFGAQLIVKPSSKVTIVQNYMGGAEQPGNKADWRHLWDTTVSYTVNSALSLMGNYDYGFDRISGAKVHWQGLAAYARIQANSWLALSPRFEWYDDHDGFTTGSPQTIKEITLTSEHKLSNGLITRLEYRRDFSDREFFGKAIGRLVQAQSSLSFGLVYAFSSRSDQ